MPTLGSVCYMLRKEWILRTDMQRVPGIFWSKVRRAGDIESMQ